MNKLTIFEKQLPLRAYPKNDLDVILDTQFKFGKIANRKRDSFINRFGRKSTYFIYSSCVPNEELIDIFNFYKK